jgi:hypothetical protein
MSHHRQNPFYCAVCSVLGGVSNTVLTKLNFTYVAHFVDLRVEMYLSYSLTMAL